jgi:excinuclease ABC subunit C
MRKGIKNLRRLANQKQSLKEFPENSGIYIFWQKSLPIYIGKAINLKARLESYFSLKLSPKTARMVEEADSISFLEVSSELEALILEAKLIRLNQPKYNLALKDDKHPLYIKITKEVYPRVLTSRRIGKNEKVIDFFGPFPSSASVREVLKLLRRIFPFSEHKLGKRACLYSHIKLCNPCPNVIERIDNIYEKDRLLKLYRKNIFRLRRILQGKMQTVRKELEKEMKAFSAKEAYEDAAAIRTQIEKLDYITQPTNDVSLFLENPNLLFDIREEELNTLKKVLIKYIKLPEKFSRIECFDVAHLRGKFPTASMVTFISAEPDKNLYRRFKIRQTKAQDDISSMSEVARRRAANFASWGRPDLIVVDGGKAQVAAFEKVFNKFNIPVVGLTKRLETLIIPFNSSFVEINPRPGPALNLLQRLRNEAHRFAQSYHHKLVKKSLLEYVGNS